MKPAQQQQSDELNQSNANNEREEMSVNQLQTIEQFPSYNNRPRRSLKKMFRWAFIIIICLAIGILILDVQRSLLQDDQLLRQEIQQIKDKLSERKSLTSTKSKPSQNNPSDTTDKNKPINQPLTPISNEKQPILSYQQQLVDQKDAFIISKKLWMYENKDPLYLSSLIVANNKHFANQSGFQAIVVNRINFRKYLSPKTGQEVEDFIKAIQSMNSNRIPIIIRTFILLNIINENGGVMIDGETVITENFLWIKQISQNMHVNRGTRGIKPQVVGFYALEYTNDKAKENIKPFPGMHEVDKYMSIFPSIEEYFMAADKNTAFITEIIAKIPIVIKNPQIYQQNRHQYNVRNINGIDNFFQFLFIAGQTVLQDRQKQIDSSNKESYRKFAIDYYGLNLINCYYGPYKNQYFWGNSIREQFIMLTQYDLSEYQANYGPMRYAIRMNPFHQFNNGIQQTKSGSFKPILEGSFIQKILFPKNDVSFIQKNKEKPFINETNEPWLSLPKIIWVFYDKGLENARVSNQMCVQNMRRMGKLSGFVVNDVSVGNAHQYLDAETLKKISYTMSNAKLNTYTPSLSDLYRLALISKHGGIYLDTTFLLLQNLDWLINIGRYPSQHIFNRFGHLPKALLLFYSNSASPFDWEVNQKHNTKSIWHLGYESSFIAAQKGNELVTEWFEMLTRLYIKPYHEIAQIFKTECKISQYQWISQHDHYLIVMDSLKCVIARKQQALVSGGKNDYISASDYYKVWSMNGNMGQQKLRTKTNYQNINSKDIRLCYRFSQQYTEGLVGKFQKVAKFYGAQGLGMANFATSHMNGDFSGETHPDSIFMRYLWQDNFSLEYVNNQPRLKVRS